MSFIKPSVLYLVIEHFLCSPPKTFGEYQHRKEFGAVKVGDMLMLTDRNGTPFYSVRVEKIYDGTLHVISSITMAEIDERDERAQADAEAASAEAWSHTEGEI